MKIIIPGGTGQVGNVLRRAFRTKGHEVLFLSRNASNSDDIIYWDAKTLGDWTKVIDGADAVINLAGRSVNCRYSKENLKSMMDSRVESTKVIGQAINRAARPPRVWLQASTATIYAHTFGTPHDEKTGLVGGNEPDVPKYWKISIDIAQAWERALSEASTPQTRKVALRSAMIMSPDKGGIFDTLLNLTRLGLGGAIAGGKQFVSWIHEHDFVRSVEFLLEHDEFEGVVNLSSPNPLSQKEFMAAIRHACGMPIGLPATKWMISVGAFFMRTDPELILKSRRVIPGRLLSYGFSFKFPEWPAAVQELTK